MVWWSRILCSLSLAALVCVAPVRAIPARAVPNPVAPPLDVSTSAAAAALPAVSRPAQALKTIVNRAAVAHSATPEAPPRPRMSPAAFLKERLGAHYHARTEWAGHAAKYRPKLASRRVWRPIGKVQYVTIHHADGVPDEHPAAMIRNIFRGHTARRDRLDAPDVGYHFFVDRDGDVWEGRDARMLGTHVGSTPEGLNNEDNLGVCGLGTFLHENPPRAMVAGAARLCDLLAEYYGRPLTVRGHKDWLDIHRFHPYGGVDCPGRLEAAVRQARRLIARRYGSPTRLAQSIR